jgi:hypothetical protein
VNRPEETRTLNFRGFLPLQGQSLAAIVYECSQKPLNLLEIICTTPKPSPKDKGTLAGVIATYVRSLNIHFGLRHTALRTESFVFFGDPEKPELTNPYLLD